jgi:S1-C subfamily serine protease
VRVSGRTLVHQPALGGQTPESILIPPAWDEGDLSQDLALLVFGQPLGTQRGISVYPRMGGNINVGDPVFIAGYGFNEHRQKPGEILWGTNKVRSLSAQYIDVKGMDEGDFPAGDDVTAAPGDSGGPIFDTRFNLVGITSRGCLPEEGCSLRVSEHLRLEGTLGRWISPRIQ